MGVLGENEYLDPRVGPDRRPYGHRGGTVRVPGRRGGRTKAGRRRVPGEGRGRGVSEVRVISGLDKEDYFMCTVGCGGPGCGEVTEERNGVVLGRVLGGTEGGPGVREAQRVFGGGGGGRSRGAGRGVARQY